MPIVKRPPQGQDAAAPVQQAAPTAPPKTSWGLKDLFGNSPTVDKVGDWAGMATRLGSGFLPTAAVGGVPGALTGGAAETLAEFLEGSMDVASPGRIAVESGIGAIPLGKTLSAGRAIKSGLKSGAFNAVGDLARQGAEGNFVNPQTTPSDLINGTAPAPPGWDWKRTALAAGLGAGGGAVMGSLMHGEQAAAKEAAPIIESMGGGVPRQGKTPGAYIPAQGSARSPHVGGTDNYTGGSNTIHGIDPKAPRGGPASAIEQAIEGHLAQEQPRMRVSHEVPYRMEGGPSVQDVLPVASHAPDSPAGSFTQDAQRQLMLDLSKDPEAVAGGRRMMNRRSEIDAGRQKGGRRASDIASVLPDTAPIPTEAEFAEAAANADTHVPYRAPEVVPEGPDKGKSFEQLLSEELNARTKQPTQLPALKRDLDANINADRNFRAKNAAANGLEEQRNKQSFIRDLENQLNDEFGHIDENLAAQKAGDQSAIDRALLEDRARGLEAKPPTISRSTKVDGSTVNERWVAQLQDAVDEAGDASEAVAKAGSEATGDGGARSVGGPRTNNDLLQNITDPTAMTVYENRIKAGDTPRSAYRAAYKAQQFRTNKLEQGAIDATQGALGPAAQAAPEAAQAAVPAAAGKVRKPKTAGEFDSQVNDLLSMFTPEEAKVAPKAPSAPVVPPAAQAKLDAAKETYQPEAYDELTRLSGMYNDPDILPKAKKAIGKQLRELAKFMSGEGGGALDPKGEKGAASTHALINMALGAGGAATGAALDASQGDDPVWDGAVEGGLAGLAPGAIAHMGGFDLSKADEAIKGGKDFVMKLPQLQRAMLLANPQGLEQGMPALGVNAFAAPYGSTIMHGLEQTLKGDDRGRKLLTSARNPFKFIKRMGDMKDEAFDALIHGEGGRSEMGGTGINPDSIVDKTLSLPGQVMTQGDKAAQKLMQDAGYDAKESAIATLTSEPEGLKKIADITKGHEGWNWLLNMMLPFRRTPLNVLEQGAQRTPGIGMFVGPKRSARDYAVEQGLGAASMAANAALGYGIDDDHTAKNVKRLTSNFGGKYSLPSNLGFIMGHAMNKGQSPWEAVNARNIEQMFPLPSTEVISDTFGGLRKMFTGKANSPLDVLPDSLTFGPARKWLTESFDPQAAKPKSVHGIVKRPRKDGQ